MNPIKSPFPEAGIPVLDGHARFQHVMALALNPRDDHATGLIRCILSRSGDVVVKGQIDRSELRFLHRRPDGLYEIGEVCRIRNQDEILAAITDPRFEFIGLEDPDIVHDEATGLLHVYFSISFVSRISTDTLSHLGHAFGPSLESLEMTMPVLGYGELPYACAKEVSIAPPGRNGTRHHLVESSFIDPAGVYNSTVRVALASEWGAPWSFGPHLLIPSQQPHEWISGHASPGPLLPRSFVDVGEGRLVGFLNGRARDHERDGKTYYGMFAVGLFIYDYENARIDWVSSEPVITDREARTITFASQFVMQSPSTGTLFAHVDDSFVRAFSVRTKDVRAALPG